MVIAKLRLLDAGYLLDMLDLEAVISQKEFAVEEEGETRSTKLDEAALLSKISDYVTAMLTSKPADPNGRSVGIVAENRRKVIHEFMKRQGASTMCQCCRAHIPNLHRHGNTKVFQTPLRRNLQAAMDAKSLTTKLEDEADSEADEAAAVEEEEEVPEDAGTSRGMKYMTPLHVYEHLKSLWRNERTLLDMIFASGSVGKRLAKGKPVQSNPSEQDHRIFFTEVIAVPPCRFRPPSVFGDSSFDHPQNTYLVEILRLSQRLVEIRQQVAKDEKEKDDDEPLKTATTTDFARLVDTWGQLQLQVNYFYDSSTNTAGAGKIPPAGIKQILEKKEGLFRKHMYPTSTPIFSDLLMRFFISIGWERE